MKTKEQMQTIVNELRGLCKLYGVALVAGNSMTNGPEIQLHDIADLLIDATPIYVYGMTKQQYDSATLKPVNVVVEVPYATNRDGQELAHLAVAGIVDVEGHTKPRIVLSQYYPHGVGARGQAVVVDVDSLDEVEKVPFVNSCMQGNTFTALKIGIKDGPFGTLTAWFEDHPPVVLGFIEGLSHGTLLEKWPEDIREGGSDGSATDAFGG